MKKIYHWILDNPLRYAFLVATFFLCIYVIELAFFDGYIRVIENSPLINPL